MKPILKQQTILVMDTRFIQTTCYYVLWCFAEFISCSEHCFNCHFTLILEHKEYVLFMDAMQTIHLHWKLLWLITHGLSWFTLWPFHYSCSVINLDYLKNNYNKTSGILLLPCGIFWLQWLQSDMEIYMLSLIVAEP